MDTVLEYASPPDKLGLVAVLPRILVVEDDAMQGMLLAEMLDDMGYVVCGLATTEAEAIAAAAREKPDLMLVDIGLGSGSGLSAMDVINQICPVACVYMSGNIAKLRALRPDVDMLEKPFQQACLAAALGVVQSRQDRARSLDADA